MPPRKPPPTPISTASPSPTLASFYVYTLSTKINTHLETPAQLGPSFTHELARQRADRRMQALEGLSGSLRSWVLCALRKKAHMLRMAWGRIQRGEAQTQRGRQRPGALIICALPSANPFPRLPLPSLQQPPPPPPPLSPPSSPSSPVPPPSGPTCTTSSPSATVVPLPPRTSSSKSPPLIPAPPSV